MSGQGRLVGRVGTVTFGSPWSGGKLGQTWDGWKCGDPELTHDAGWAGGRPSLSAGPLEASSDMVDEGSRSQESLRPLSGICPTGGALLVRDPFERRRPLATKRPYSGQGCGRLWGNARSRGDARLHRQQSSCDELHDSVMLGPTVYHCQMPVWARQLVAEEATEPMRQEIWRDRLEAGSLCSSVTVHTHSDGPCWRSWSSPTRA